MSLQAPASQAWCQLTVLRESVETLGRQGLLEGFGGWERGPEEDILMLAHHFFFLSLLLGLCEVLPSPCTCTFHHSALLHSGPQTMAPANQGLKPLKLLSLDQLFTFMFSGILSQQWKAD